MAVSPLEDFELALTPQSGNRGLARRLMDGALRPPEQQYLQQVEQVVQLEAEGLKYPAIAEVLNLTGEQMQRFVRTQKYRLVRKYVTDRALLQTDQQAADRRRAERRRWDANGAKALDYYDQAFRRYVKDDDPPKGQPPRFKKGDFCDLDRAERAAQLFARSAGWTEPVQAHAKPRDLKLGVIQQAMQGIAAADRKETVVRVTVTETIEVGQRDRETAGMSGDA